MVKLFPRFLASFRLLSLFALLPAALKAEVVAHAGPDRTVAIESGCSARVELDASASTILARPRASFTWKGPFPEGGGVVKGLKVTVTLERGIRDVQLLVESGAESSTDTVSVTVRDVMPPEIQSVQPSRDSMWPPNHRMQPIEIQVQVTDNCDAAPECEVVGIDSDEAEDGQGDGHTSPDSAINGALSVLLRAERASPGDGRVYTVRVRCRDDEGNVSRSQTQVRVPHDVSRDGEAQADSESHCRLKIRFGDSGKSRIVLQLDVDRADEEIPANETVLRKDDLEGYELKVELGSIERTGIVSSSGRVNADGLLARWYPTKGVLRFDVSSQDLAEALDLDSNVYGKRIEVLVPLQVTVTASALEKTGVAPIVLYGGSSKSKRDAGWDYHSDVGGVGDAGITPGGSHVGHTTISGPDWRRPLPPL